MHAPIRTALPVLLIAAFAGVAACARRSPVVPSTPPPAAVIRPSVAATLERSVDEWRRRAEELRRLEQQTNLSDVQRTRLEELRREIRREAGPLHDELLELQSQLVKEAAALDLQISLSAEPPVFPGLKLDPERRELVARRDEIVRAMGFTYSAMADIEPFMATAAPEPPPPPLLPPRPPSKPVPQVPSPSPPTPRPPVTPPARPAVVPTPVVRPDGAQDRTDIAKYLDQIRPGHVVFDPPKKMVEGESETVHLLVSADATIQDLKAELLRRAETGAARQYIEEKVSVTRVMRARLTGVDFDIDDTEYQERLTDATPTTEWTWQVRPKRAGRLALTVTLIAMIDDAGTLRPVARPFERIVTVETRPQTWLNIIEQYGPPAEVVYGAIGAGLTAALAWWHKRRRVGRSGSRRRAST